MEEKEEKVGKIEPNEIYIINKLNFANQANVLAKICMTLKYAKREPINPDIFMDYITKGLAFGRGIILVTFNEKQDLNTCIVMLLKNNPIKGKVLWIEWAWTDGKDLKLGNKVFEKVEELAQKLGAKRIAAAMERGIEAVYKKYGLEKEYVVVSKEVKTNVEDN
ncbi:hypothetical protein ES704_03023 [subsurface metagenome]|jgi:hypothetical protein